MDSYDEDELLRHLPKVTGIFRNVVISDDEILQETFESEDIAALVEDLSAELNVDCEHLTCSGISLGKRNLSLTVNQVTSTRNLYHSECLLNQRKLVDGFMTNSLKN